MYDLAELRKKLQERMEYSKVQTLPHDPDMDPNESVPSYASSSSYVPPPWYSPPLHPPSHMYLLLGTVLLHLLLLPWARTQDAGAKRWTQILELDPPQHKT